MRKHFQLLTSTFILLFTNVSLSEISCENFNDKKQAAILFKKANDGFEAFFPRTSSKYMKTFTQQQKLEIAASAIQYWSLSGSKGLIGVKGHMSVVGVLFKSMESKIGDMPTTPSTTNQMEKLAKFLSKEVSSRYANRVPSNVPSKVSLPYSFPNKPSAALVKWAKQHTKNMNLGTSLAEQQRKRFCTSINLITHGTKISRKELDWTTVYERKISGIPNNVLPPQLQNAITQFKKFKKSNEEKQARENEKQHQLDFIEERKRENASRLAQWARADKPLTPSQVNQLCRYYPDLCQRADSILSYRQCMAQAADDAGAYYNNAVNAGARPSDGTWSGTYSGLKRQYEQSCQQYKPSGYYK